MRPLDYFYDNPSWGEGRYSQKFCAFFAGLIRVIFGAMFRYRAYDLHEQLAKLPEGQGLIIAGNHHSNLDPLFVLSVLRPRPVRFMAKEEIFTLHPLIARLAAWVGAFPVRRDTADLAAVKRTARMLKRGEYVGIFPEGTRVRSADQTVVYHEGVALIARLAKATVLPVRLWGTERIWPKGAHFLRLPRVTLRFGEPLSLDDEMFRDMEKDALLAAFTDEVMRRVYSLEPPRPVVCGEEPPRPAALRAPGEEPPRPAALRAPGEEQ
ncbi:MAG: 1-acyl-sn-glycerol-3-phosphate acyltransferase [Coriobacteriales bacterium]|jgi:1-acyl-sn-glycerol-3-phosphate acyltransferase|nr:1-acyl-sn-glycerol-3-phosphate acyltransferase [Coriobacteriales bacterium]